MFRRIFSNSIITRNGDSFSRQTSIANTRSSNFLKCGCLVIWRCAAFLHRKTTGMTTLETLNFDNSALRSLPIDTVTDNYVRSVAGACFSKVKPTPVDKPSLVAVSQPALYLLGIPPSEINRDDFVQYFSGNRLLPGSDPAAHCYCGHQFGYFSGQLGDGATMYLGEVINKSGERWEIQFKGAGKTPYSRTADGRKVLRSTIREFLCSEAIHHLGIPTTRAGTCVTSESTVVRDIFYSGDPIDEKCTVVLRIAPTFLRFGSFEIFKTLDPQTGRAGPSVGRNDILIQMLDYTSQTFYPEIWEKHKSDKQTMYIEMYKEVIRRTAMLVAEWQCVGWCHGVLNTDNMSIVGLTIDYGPFGFMDKFDPNYICNGSDDSGRYSYKNQPDICKWNCMKLGEAIQGAVPLTETKPHLDIFDEVYSDYMKQKIRKKFGLLNKELETDKDIYDSFLETMQKTGADFTNCFRCLSILPLPGSPGFQAKLKDVKEYILTQCSTLEELKSMHKPEMDPRQLQAFLAMVQSNPGLVNALGRNFASITRDLEKLEKIKEMEDKTDEDQRKTNEEAWDSWLQKYEERLDKEVEGKTDLIQANTERVRVMNSNNPRFILRNYIAQNAIKAAEKGDYSEVRRVLKLLENPYSDQVDLGDLALPQQVGNVSKSKDDKLSDGGATSSKSKETGELRSYTGMLYESKPPDWSLDLKVT
ncbi:protein adenylyltransferase SelO, mitochondrial-like [Mytilus galloprovincialis]|uniref:protein adenylyltransferase SelO, mitochondrial-like n=1 Tax=Mytilus galloprovincialis TaxID=29158 RepID=UPI003F7CB1D6